jgi:hypothetical protein
MSLLSVTFYLRVQEVCPMFSGFNQHNIFVPKGGQPLIDLTMPSLNLLFPITRLSNY